MWTFQHAGRMAAIEPLEGFRTTGQETHGLLNQGLRQEFPWLLVRGPAERGFTSSLQ